MGKVKNENYYQIQGWMVNELGLKGNELMIYAIIYGFSQTDGQYFTGSQQYLADWTNATDRSVRNTLSALVEKGLLEKRDKTINKVKYCEYKALIPEKEEKISAGGTEKISAGTEKISAGGTEKISAGTENISANNDKNNNILDIKENRIPYLSIRDMYNNTCVSFPKITTLSEGRKKAIRARFKTYTLADFQLVFEKAEASSFLKGKNNRNWSATFDWMIKDANMAKIYDGNYDDRDSVQSKHDEWDEFLRG
jgi:hypothetical protein